MASLTRSELEDIYWSAKRIYTCSRLNDVRRECKKIAMAVEGCIGQIDRRAAETWDVEDG